MNTCPICGLEHILSDMEKCPQCDSDMTCFNVLDSLPDELPESVPIIIKKNVAKKYYILLISLLVCLAIVVITLFTNLLKHDGVKILNHTTYFKIHKTPKQEVVKQIVKQSSEKIKFWIYTANKYETLWSISKKHYGLGKYYIILLEYNNHIGIYNIRNGAKIKILNDVKLARNIYKKIILKENGKLYWRYTVAQGDSIQSLSKRFYRIDSNQIVRLNPDIQLQRGEKIKILYRE